MRPLPLFPVTTVGSWPRSAALTRAVGQHRRGKLDRAGLDRITDQAVTDVVRAQERAGVDIVTDGEQRRDNFYSFVADKLSGVKLMTLQEMLDVIEDKQTFERILQTLDVPAYSLSNPTCVGKLARNKPLAVDELRFLKKHTDRPVKIPLPGPYLLTRAMFVPEVSKAVYPSKEDLAEDVVRILREEIAELVNEGVDFIQLDEPVLTEVVFTQGETRTFMCASLAAGGDPAEELELAVSLMNRVLADIPDRVITGLHVCRGNWSKNESTLLSGSYHPLAAYFERMHLKQLVLEYATERAGDLMQFSGKSLGLGVVNPRTDEIESAEHIRSVVQKALELYPPDRLFLNPDCGFGTFSNSPVADAAVARQKLEAIVAAARSLR